MAGVRIRHPIARNGLFLVKHYRRYPVPFYCERCKVFETQKTYHLDLDDAGTVIVSPVVFERLKEIGLAGFEIMNEVRNPPPITLKMPGRIEQTFKVMEVGARQEQPRGQEA